MEEKKLKKPYRQYTADQFFEEFVARKNMPMSAKVYIWFRRRDLLDDVVMQLDSAYDVGDSEIDRLSEDYAKIDEYMIVDDCIDFYYDRFLQNDKDYAETHCFGKLDVEYEHSVARECDENEKANDIQDVLNNHIPYEKRDGDIYRVRGTKARPVPEKEQNMKKVVVEIRETRVKKIMFSVPKCVDTKCNNFRAEIAHAVALGYASEGFSMRGARAVLTQFFVDGLGWNEFTYPKRDEIVPDYEGKIPKCWISYNGSKLINPQEVKED